MKAALALTVVVGAFIHGRPAHACSISAAPDAYVFGPQDKTVRGHRPWINLWMVKPTEAVKLSIVDPACVAEKICTKAKAIAFDRSGQFVRPTQALPSGARVQIVTGKTLLEEFTVTSAEAATKAPAWDGTTAPASRMAKEGMCSPAGPQITMKVKPTKANLDDAVLIVWLNKPDAKKPLAGVASIYGVKSDAELDMHNGFGSVWMKSPPRTIWTAISDGDGNVGPIVEHKL